MTSRSRRAAAGAAQRQAVRRQSALRARAAAAHDRAEAVRGRRRRRGAQQDAQGVLGPARRADRGRDGRDGDPRMGRDALGVLPRPRPPLLGRDAPHAVRPVGVRGRGHLHRGAAALDRVRRTPDGARSTREIRPSRDRRDPLLPLPAGRALGLRVDARRRPARAVRPLSRLRLGGRSAALAVRPPLGRPAWLRRRRAQGGGDQGYDRRAPPRVLRAVGAGAPGPARPEQAAEVAARSDAT